MGSASVHRRPGRPVKLYADAPAARFAAVLNQIVGADKDRSRSWFGQQIAPGRNDRWFDEYARGRKLLPLPKLTALLALDYFTDEGRRLLAIAYLRDQAAAGVGAVVPITGPPKVLVCIGALNYDFVVGKSLAIPDPGRRLSGYSSQPDAIIGTQAQFDEFVEHVCDGLNGTPRQLIRPFQGGSAFNALRLVSHGVPYSPATHPFGFVGVCGEVPFGYDVPRHDRTLVGALGCDSRMLLRVAGEVGGQCISVVKRRGDGEFQRQLRTFPGANVHLTDFLFQNFWTFVAYLAHAKRVHISSVYDDWSPHVIALGLEEARKKNHDLKISFDPGDVWASGKSEAINQILSLSNTLFVNELELEKMAENYGANGDFHDSEDEYAQRVLQGMGSDSSAVVVVKHKGRTGVHSFGRKPGQLHLTGLASSVEDDTGAGDAVAAGYLIGQIKGETIYSSVDLGMKLAKLKVEVIGPPSEDLIRGIVAGHQPWVLRGTAAAETRSNHAGDERI